MRLNELINANENDIDATHEHEGGRKDSFPCASLQKVKEQEGNSIQRLLPRPERPRRECPSFLNCDIPQSGTQKCLRPSLRWRFSSAWQHWRLRVFSSTGL